MAAKHIVQCRACRQKMDINKLEEGSDWVMPSKNWYYHTNCYENFTNKTTKAMSLDTNVEYQENFQTEEFFWKNVIYDFFRKDLKTNLNFSIFQKQWQYYISKKKYTPKGIYFAVRYFYSVKNGDVEKSNGGIGIIPYVYEESAEYWYKRNEQEAGILEKIENQIRQYQEAKKVVIYKTKDTIKKKKTIDLNDIQDWEEVDND